MRTRIAIGAPGILLGLFGIYRLLTQIPASDLVTLLIWLIAALILHDGILSPIVVGVGAGIARMIPARARGFVQWGLIAAVGVTVIALPMIHREDTQPTNKALLQQNFGGNLALVLGILAALVLIAYVATVIRQRQLTSAPGRPMPAQRTSATNDLPPDDQSSATA